MGKTKSIKNILFIAPLTPIHGQGYVSLQTLSILKKANFNLKVINTFSHSYFFKIFYNVYILVKIFLELTFKGNGFEKVYITPSRNFFSSLRDFLVLFLIKFRNYFLKNKNKNKIKIIAHLHGSDLNSFLNNKNYYFKILKNLYKSELHRMIILSKSHSKYALGNDFKSYAVIHNPIDFKFMPYNLNYKTKDDLEISFISIPDKNKGLLESIKWVKSNILKSSWVFNVIGWTKDNFLQQYKHLDSKSLNEIIVDKKIKFLGPVYGKKKFDILQSSNFFIFLSKYSSEAQPVSVIEAILYKNAVLVSNFKMLKDFSIYNSVLIENKNILEEDILNIVSNENILNDSMKFLKKNHSFSTYKTKILDCFGEK